MVLERDASSVGALIPLLESEPTNVPQGMPSVFGLRKNAPTSVVPGLRAPILPVMFGTPGAFHAPAVSSTPSTQARKGAPLFENFIGLKGFSPSPRPFRNWTLGADRSAGAWGRDEIRNVTGSFSAILCGETTVSGALNQVLGGGYTTASGSGGTKFRTLILDAAQVVPTGPQNVPQHVWQPVVIYLGRPK